MEIVRDKRILGLYRERVLRELAKTSVLDIASIHRATNIPTEELEFVLRGLFRQSPPVINKIGTSDRYQLSPSGRTYLHLPAPKVEQPTLVAPITIDPGPRGQLIKALKSKPCSRKELVHKTGLKLQQVDYFLHTLADRGLMGTTARSTVDGRIVLYRLKSTPTEEPPKPVLTPSIVPFTAEDDWRTWFQRLTINPSLEISEPTQPVAIQEHRHALPKILIVGNKHHEFVHTMKSKFKDKFRLHFRDGRQDNLSHLEEIAKNMDYIFLRTDACSHVIASIVNTVCARNHNVKKYYVKGNAGSVVKFISGKIP